MQDMAVTLPLRSRFDVLDLRERAGRDELDSLVLRDCLSGYRRPRDKATALLESGALVRLRRGLYVLGERLRRGPLCRELLANLIYGPSCVSLEYALGWYGLLPEAVHAVTSVTPGRSRRFDTPVGLFTYRQVSSTGFAAGMDLIETPDGRSFLMATPERALADLVMAARGAGVRSRKAMRALLLEDLRVDEAGLAGLDCARFDAAAESGNSPRLRLLAAVVRDMQGLHRKEDDTDA